MIIKFLYWLVLLSISNKNVDFSNASQCFNKAEIVSKIKISKEKQIFHTVYFQNKQFDIYKNYFNLEEYKDMIYHRESYPIGYNAVGYSGRDFGKYQFRDCNIAIPVDEFLKDTLYQEHLMDSYTLESVSILKENGLDVNHYHLLLMHCIGQYGALPYIKSENKKIK